MTWHLDYKLNIGEILVNWVLKDESIKVSSHYSCPVLRLVYCCGDVGMRMLKG